MLLAALSCLALNGCLATPSERAELASRIAGGGGMARTTLSAGAFTLTGYYRLADPGAPVHVYIEGDGFAWESRSEISKDPTPLDPVALRLAAVDPGPNVLYLARPCQYRDPRARDSCGPAYWTSQRFSESVIAATNSAIDRMLPDPGRKILLIGYSGGGAVAALVAARRNDVIGLVTVAGTLAHSAWTRHHGVSPLAGSLDPIDVAAGLSHLPQSHYVGSEDRIMPRSIADTYARRAGSSDCLSIRPVQGATHNQGWIERWPDLIRHHPRCSTGSASPRTS